jgi:cyclopropane-fatty-acyl-phospholipid synthase
MEQWLLKRVFAAIGPAPIELVLGNGQPVSPPGVQPVATFRIRDLATLSALAFDPEIGFGEGYASGRIEVDGDLVAALVAIYDSIAEVSGAKWSSGVQSQWLQWLHPNTLQGSRSNIHHHYDLGNDFYKLWLDSEMVYTCAYFPTATATLEAAQIAKLDYVCRKLQLQPGETVVEAGCGWGALALYMAANYGVTVKAFNISREQISYARQAAIQRGLSGRVEFIEDDYRNVTGRYDAFASVGMLEHVGVGHYADLGNVVHRTIGDCGRGLLHFIGRSYEAQVSRWIRKRIFPGGYVPTLREALAILEPYQYAVLDIENLRIHYAQTIEHWLARFDRCREQISAAQDEWFRRAWRLYLAGSIAAFRCGSLQLFQVVFAGSKRLPMLWTRAPLYQEDGGGRQGRRERSNDQWAHVAY